MRDALAVSPDGRLAALGREDDVLLVDVTTGAEVRRTSLRDGDEMYTATWSRDGKALTVGGRRGLLYVLNSDDLSPAVAPRQVAPGFVIALATSPDGTLMASVDSDGQVLLYDTTTWRPLGKPVVSHWDWGRPYFTPDGQTLRVYYQDQVRLDISVEPDEWLRNACRLAARELQRDEWAAVRPGEPWRQTCGR